ncbi:DNA gyrase inhibitor YacG [uncultured Piscinibacter sp.]|uniref:DNA gyrase inhibitor YacG n=1 Tax=uncultured Piscinibacter sp. TaxID=1131835 RepID=UPI00260910CF|nr:DNA gyrase inhibitor YacG [uncultured Piscinibacter sp.]
MTTPTTPRTVRCPACGGPSEYGAANAWRPFCSERCKNHDFGAWASESYRVSEPARSVDVDPGAESTQRH